MDEKKVVPIEEIQSAIMVIADFNKLNLDNIELTENGEKIVISNEIRESWKFIGMSNRSFVECRYWERTEEELNGDEKMT